MPQYLTIDAPEPSVAVVSLNRPDAANALNTAMAQEITAAFAGIAKSNKYRVVILAGHGKHFCAGADLKERKGMDEAAWKAQHQIFREARDTILHCPLPVIAAVQGAAYAGGLELALACDFIYAAHDAKFALTEATLGIMPGMGGTQTLPRAVGIRRAREILFTGKHFTAAEGQAWGMVNKCCDAVSLMGEVMGAAKIIADNAPLSVKAIKSAVNQGVDMALPDAFAKELALYNTLLASKDRYEGVGAYNEKRKPVFKGE